jgi:hypothetical protein
MKINLIGDFTSVGVSQDARVFLEILRPIFEDKAEVFRVTGHFPECGQADVNVFFDTFNPSLVSYAGKNIWIISHEKLPKSYVSYIPLVDEVWTRSEQTFQILLNKTCLMTPPIQFQMLKWTSMDKQYAKIQNYSKAVVLVGKNAYRNPINLFKAYLEIKNTDLEMYNKLPSLTVPYLSTHLQITVPDEIAEKVTLVDKFLSENDYDDLLHECGLAICVSVYESYNHSVLEAISTGCNMILSGIPTFKEFSSDDILFTQISRIVEHPTFVGNILESSVESIVECLQTYVARDFAKKKEVSWNMRELYERKHLHSVTVSTELFEKKLKDLPEYSLQSSLPTDLPNVSILTLVKDRPACIQLLKYCYLIQIYPTEKVEWVIVDDGKESSEKEFENIPNVKYVRLEKEYSIGEKRNIAVENASYDILACMDDDDVYNERSLIQRVSMMLMKPEKACAFCSTIPCYDIQNDLSFMSVPSPSLSMSQTVSEATLVFTRSFWENAKFEDVQIGEAENLVKHREKHCRVLSPKDILVSLLHSSNARKRERPDESNGCHYDFNVKVASFISDISKETQSILSP